MSPGGRAPAAAAADNPPPQRLSAQLQNLSVPFTEDFDAALATTDQVVDAIFGKRSPPRCQSRGPG